VHNQIAQERLQLIATLERSRQRAQVRARPSHVSAHLFNHRQLLSEQTPAEFKKPALIKRLVRFLFELHFQIALDKIGTDLERFQHELINQLTCLFLESPLLFLIVVLVHHRTGHVDQGVEYQVIEVLVGQVDVERPVIEADAVLGRAEKHFEELGDHLAHSQGLVNDAGHIGRLCVAMVCPLEELYQLAQGLLVEYAYGLALVERFVPDELEEKLLEEEGDGLV